MWEYSTKYHIAKYIFLYGVSLLMLVTILYGFSSIVSLVPVENLILLLVIAVSALGLAYVLFALSGYIEAKIVLKHRLESPLLSTIILLPIYYSVVIMFMEILLPLMPSLISFFEFLSLVIVAPVLVLLIIVYILSS